MGQSVPATLIKLHRSIGAGKLPRVFPWAVSFGRCALGTHEELFTRFAELHRRASDTSSIATSQRLLGGTGMQGGNKEYKAVQGAGVDEALQAAIDATVKTLAERIAG
ncbi:MAG: hypothetical protein C4K60_13140 [Ideonella sp. MAG2]|nr:MAG: hypothetical protein C4K60_13140 [Ideonella sp. MAG2]